MDDPRSIVRGLRRIAARHVREFGAEAVRVLRGSPPTLTRAFDAATAGRRMSRWTTTGSDADAEITLGAAKLRERSRDVERNSPHGRRIIVEFASDLVGSGLQPQCETGSDRLNRQWQALWADWSYQCDPVTRGTHYGQQFAAAMDLCRSGGLLIRRRWRRVGEQAHDGRPLAVPLEVALHELDYLDTTKDSTYTTPSGGYVVGGVEFDSQDRRVAYWLYPEHPGAAGRSLYASIGQSVRVPASEVLHLYGYTTGRPSQVQAVPWLHAVIARLWDYDGYVDASTLARRMAASVPGYVTGGDPDGAADGVDGIAPVADASAAQVLDSRGYPVEQYEPGLIAYLPNGKDIKFPSQPDAPGYSDFARVTLHEIMAGAMTPYEAGTGDLSQVSFISGRMGRISRRRLMDALREQVFVPLALRPIAQWFTDAAILAGRLPDRREGYPVTWHDTQREEADEQARVRAIVLKIRAGLTSWERAVREEGIDPEVLIEEIRHSNAALDAEPPIVLDSDPRRTTIAGVWQVSQELSEINPPQNRGQGGTT